MSKPNDKWTFQLAIVQEEVSCSHWGLFAKQREVTTPFGYRFKNPGALGSEALRPDGMIEIVAI